jgi:hypothetical protein
MATTDGNTPPPPPPPPQEDYQKVFYNHVIADVKRGVYDAQLRVFDWEIRPKRPYFGSKLSIVDFCLRPVVAFVPHKAGIHPYCPSCERNDGIDEKNAIYDERPIPVFKMTTHHFLLSPRYKCLGCNSSFRAHHPRSMKLGGSDIIGLFRFHVPWNKHPTSLVDDALYHHIAGRIYDTPSSIERSLMYSYSAGYINNMIQYLVLGARQKIKSSTRRGGQTFSVADPTQPKIQFTAATTSNTAGRSINGNGRALLETSRKRKTLLDLKGALQNKKMLLKDKILLSNFIKLKSKHTAGNTINIDVSIGKLKAVALVECGFTSLREFAELWREFLSDGRLGGDGEKKERVAKLF